MDAGRARQLRWVISAASCCFRRCVVKPETSRLATLVFVLVSLPLMFGQGPQPQPRPALPPDILGPQLIAWSQLQKPLPVPPPLPHPDRPTQQPDQQSANPPAKKEQPAASTFVGT